MFGIGGGELVFILFIVLMLFGSDKVPEIARTMGKAMTNVAKPTRAMLENNFVINHIKVDTMQRSSDGTVKNAVRLHATIL